jgi:hypothetical protein
VVLAYGKDREKMLEIALRQSASPILTLQQDNV